MKIDIKNYTKYLFYVVVVVCSVFIFLFNFVLYPLKYKNVIIKYSNQYQIETALIASIICNESSFNAGVTSKKGAVGLMQLMPSTAEWLCNFVDEVYEEKKLYQPEFNIKLGTYYLKYLTDKFKDVDVAVVAYNAGEGTVVGWLKDKKYSEDGKSLKLIPYKESSRYLTNVKRGVLVYRDRM
jgi:soluble lytic murein transglycosylase